MKIRNINDEFGDPIIFETLSDMSEQITAMGWMPDGGLVEGVDYEVVDSEIEAAVRKIAEAGCGIIFDDKGNGSAGLRNVESDDLIELLDEGFFADFTEADCAEECMDARANFDLLFPGSLFGDESEYWQASDINCEGDNTYRVIILLYNP